MIKTITIGDKEVLLDNNVGWAMIYRDQFGHDIIPTIMPMAAGVLDIISGLINEKGDIEEISLTDIAALADGDALMNAMVHIGGVEFTDLIYITWALAKNADEDIPDPQKWIKGFDSFPVDVVAPEVVKLIFAGLVSSKNLKKLNKLKRAVQLSPKAQKSTSTPLSSQDSSED